MVRNMVMFLSPLYPRLRSRPAPARLAGEAGGVDDDEEAVVRHRGWLWKGSQMREGKACDT